MSNIKSACVLWPGNIDLAGYGRTYQNGKSMQAHRAAYQAHYGPIEKGFQVLHFCGNRACVAIDHLFAKQRRHTTIERDPDVIRERLLAGSVLSSTGCREWVRASYQTGYGSFNLAGRPQHAHRVSYSAFIGTIPPGMHVLHRCDNRKCINPEHLFLGSNLDNVRDKSAKGRQTRGESHGTTRLTEGQVLAIRKSVGRHADIAAQFGVTRSNIGAIKSRSTWRHVQ